MRTIIVLFCLLLLLQQARGDKLAITKVQERGFLSQVNRFYLYLQFNGPIDTLLSHYSVNLEIQNQSCLDQIKLISQERILALGCSITRSIINPEVIIAFHKLSSQDYLIAEEFPHKTRNLYLIPHQQIIRDYWEYTYIFSQWIGYFLIFLFIINFVTYFLPLLRIVQFTALYLILDIQKPKIFDALLYGLFNFNKYRLYQVSLETPFVLVVQPKQYTIFHELGISPIFMGQQYSFLMQLCFLMMGVFFAYLLASLIYCFCKTKCIRYFAKRFIKDIFTNTSSLYFMMHIPLGLTALIGIRFGNRMLAWRDIVEYGVNIIGVLVLCITPGLFSGILGLFKFDVSVYLKKCYLFGARRRNFSEVFVTLDFFRDVLLLTGSIIFQKQFALLVVLILLIVQFCVLIKTNVFAFRTIKYLKVFQLLLLIFYTLLFILFYILQELNIRLSTNLDIQANLLLAYVGIGILSVIYLNVFVQINLQLIYDYCYKFPCDSISQTVTPINQTQITGVYINDFNPQYAPVKELKSVWRQKQKIIQRRPGMLEDIQFQIDSANPLKKPSNNLLVVPSRQQNQEQQKGSPSPSPRNITPSRRNGMKNRKMSCEVRLSYLGSGGLEQMIQKHKQKDRQKRLNDKSFQKSFQTQKSKQKDKTKQSLFKQQNKLQNKMNQILSNWKIRNNQSTPNFLGVKNQETITETRIKDKRPITSIKSANDKYRDKNKNNIQSHNAMEIMSKEIIEQISSIEIDQENQAVNNKGYYLGSSKYSNLQSQKMNISQVKSSKLKKHPRFNRKGMKEKPMEQEE